MKTTIVLPNLRPELTLEDLAAGQYFTFTDDNAHMVLRVKERFWHTWTQAEIVTDDSLRFKAAGYVVQYQDDDLKRPVRLLSMTSATFEVVR